MNCCYNCHAMRAPILHSIPFDRMHRHLLNEPFVEPVFSIACLQDSFIVKSVGGQVWEGVDLSEREWADYDERKGDSVSIMELEWEFRVHKGK